MDHLVTGKERFYLFLLMIISVLIYLALILSIVGIFYIVFGAIFVLATHGMAVGFIRGNGIKVSNKQFPEVYEIAQQLTDKMRLPSLPNIYVMEAGGALNAFATKFLRRSFVVIYSDVLELAYEEGQSALNFVVAHELAHIKRNHIRWNLLFYPGTLIPFVGTAYSRACEYTCDQFAAYLVPDGAVSGLLVLAAGKKLYRKVNLEQVLRQAEEEKGFWVWLSEILSTHPNMTKRIRQISQCPRFGVDTGSGLSV